MQGTGLAKDGSYITIDWLKSDVENLNWVFTYGIGGKWGEPQPWVTIATGDPRLPPGTKVLIQEYPGKVFIVGDTGYAVGINQIDIFIGLAFTEEAFDLGEFNSKIGIIK